MSELDVGDRVNSGEDRVGTVVDRASDGELKVVWDGDRFDTGMWYPAAGLTKEEA